MTRLVAAFALLTRPLVLLPLACSHTSAAEVPKSTDQPTERLGFTVTVRSNGAFSQVIATAYPEIAEPDRLYASVGGFEAPMVSLDGHGWIAQFLGSPATVNFGLRREVGASAVGVEVPITLPEPFVLMGPTSAARSKPLNVKWDAAADPTLAVVTLQASGTCIRSISRAIDPDVGTFTFQPADWFPEVAGGSCDVTISVTRRGKSPDAAHPYTWSATPHPLASFAVEQERDLVIATSP